MKIRYLLCSLLVLCCNNYALQRDILTQKIKAPTPQWMIDQIQKDLEPFQKNGIREEDILKTLEKFKGNTLTLRCRLIKNRVYFSYYDQDIPVAYHERFHSLLYAVKFFSKYYSLPPLDFIISLQDSVDLSPEDPLLPAPVFTFARNHHISSSVLIPDEEMIRGYKGLIDSILEIGKLHPFEQKESKAFWRGSTTGGFFTLSDWQQFPRSQLVLFSQEHPELLDARFTQVIQSPNLKEIKALFNAKSLLAKPVPIPDHLAFKYLVDIDGNTCTYSRLVWILFSNSLCMKQVSDNELWYYDALKPYVHYVPFKSDMSDFAEQFVWAESHPQEVTQIIQNANIFAKTHLTQEDAFHYFYELLLAYAKLLR